MVVNDLNPFSAKRFVAVLDEPIARGAALARIDVDDVLLRLQRGAIVQVVTQEEERVADELAPIAAPEREDANAIRLLQLVIVLDVRIERDVFVVRDFRPVRFEQRIDFGPEERVSSSRWKVSVVID
jgi:hypothetical protein